MVSKKVSLKDIFTGNMPPPGIQDFTNSKTTNTTINTQKYMSKRERILDELKDISLIQQITLIESISKELRQKSSISINTRRRKLNLDGERPDLEIMK